MRGEAGIDKRGAFICDADTGTRVRVGTVGYELAASFAEHGNRRLMEKALKEPLVGLWFSKTF